jgi:Fur family transcriptional regulator, ferric uptake regulator
MYYFGERHRMQLRPPMSTRRSSRNKVSASTDWSDRLRQAGLRSTTLTLAVLELIERIGAPSSHDELARDLIAVDATQKIDRVTLYRILDRLTAAQLLVRIQGSDRVWRYAIAKRETAPGYFECDQCHTISALPSDPDLMDVLARLERRLSRTGVHRAKSAVTIHGTCRDCAHHDSAR